ncbi:Myosin-binding protein 4 [Melia azedarach]|uniref:Myosin-binding protein 4 n=1 Tax=Melia azedarach TaxID=155640 RepID=A0ACC1YSY0_MELAZ|nr:Myosin-binding protein 4 [Melia azedarach]
MAVDHTPFVRAGRHVQGITEILTSTACEWFLIFLLFIDAVFSYLLTKFARYCELQLPCILCSRLDHVLGNEKPEFYRKLLCSNHRSEISSLIYCHIHGKLADGHGMCDDCLLSFSTKSNSKQETHRLFLGKLGFDLVGCGSQSSVPIRDITPVSMSRRWCSCCNKPWKLRQNVQRLHKLKSPAIRVTKSNIPLPRRLAHRNAMKKIRDKLSGSAGTSRRIGRTGSDPLAHVGYGELKISSDCESEFPFSDDGGGGGSIICDINEAKDDVRKPQDIKFFTPDPGVSSWYDLSELNWQEANEKTCPPLPELILLEDVSSLSNIMEFTGGGSPISQCVNPPVPAESISLLDMIPSSYYLEATVGPSPEKSNVTGATDTAHITINHNEEILKTLNTTVTGIKNDRVSNSPAPVDLTYEGPKDVSELAVSGKGRQTSGIIAEQPIEKHIDRVGDDLNLLLAQNSSAQGIHLSTDSKGTDVQGGDDEVQITDASTSNGIQTLQKSVPVESESAGLESLDGSTVSEIEGESTMDRLKRQIEYDRKCMNALYKELDAERSAAAVAANEAMAMITRLQEEKAALHMDALQYLRMMEEQAEYDMDALEKANDLLAGKEKEVQDLEAELEYYRLTYPDESTLVTIAEEICDSKKENVNVENMNMVHIKNYANLRSDSTYSEVSKGINKQNVVLPSLSEFEYEKLYILQCLKRLEKKLQTCVHDMSDGGYIEEAAERVQSQGEFPVNERSSGSCHVEENGFVLQKDLSVSNGSLPDQEGLNGSIGDNQVVCKENNLVSNGQKDSRHCSKIDVVALEDEVSDLNDRLEALEEEYKFFKHTLNFLHNGNEGLQFIQEIVCRLQEIQRIGIRSRCQSAP